MPRVGPTTELNALRRFVGELETRYLSPHMASLTLAPPSRAEELDVAAFAVLVHGAMENFVEGLCLWLLGRIQANWTLRQRASRSTASLLLRTKHVGDDATTSMGVFDTVRLAVDRAKGEQSDAVRDNNGVAVKHLRTLLAPLGVDVPTDPVLVGSLDTLVKMRHEWAHQYRFGARTPISAGDAKSTVTDCLALAEKLVANAIALHL